MITYKIRVNRPCRLFIDDEEIAILEELKLTKFELPKGEYFRKVVSIDNPAISNEVVISLLTLSKAEDITLDITGLDEAKQKALPTDKFQVGDLFYKASDDGNGVSLVGWENKDLKDLVIPSQITWGHYLYTVNGVENDGGF